MTRVLAPQVNPDTMTYHVLRRHNSGLQWAARDPANMSRRDTIADIMTGELRNVVQVLECNPAENICNDVTEDILADAGVFVTDDLPLSGQDLIDARHDHERDERKHERA